jgi:outer membrane protein assembly factor BamB
MLLRKWAQSDYAIREESVVKKRIEEGTRAPRSMRKALILLMLSMTIITPLVLASIQLTSTGHNGQMAISTSNRQFEMKRDRAAAAPTVLWTYQTDDRIYHSSPAVADLLGDDELEVVVGSYDYNVYCLNGRTGSKVWNYTTGDWIESSPVIADVLGDGKLEVVVGSFDKSIYCLNGTTGEKLWSYETSLVVYTSPVVVDLDGDGKQKAVIASSDRKIYCLNGTTGDVLWNFYSSSIFNSPAVASLLGDGKLEVVVAASDFNVYCLNGTTGELLWKHSIGTGGYWISSSASPAVADLLGDGKLEVVVGSYDHCIYCLNGTTGDLLWNYETGDVVDTSPTVADLLGDGGLEVVAGSYDKNVYCLNGTTGDMLWSYNPGIWGVYSFPVVADLFGNGRPDVFIGSEDGLYCLDGATGSKLWRYETAGAVFCSPVVADLLGDGDRELIVPSYQGFVYCMVPSDTAPPATITDLAASSPTNSSIILTWIAPGDDGMKGKAMGYLLKYSASGQITGSNWSAATTYAQSWVPAKNGTSETHSITGLSPETTYWFAIEAYDKAVNYGDISNSPSATTLKKNVDDGDAGRGNIAIIVTGVVIVPPITIAIAVVIAKKREARTAVTRDKESAMLTKINSRDEEGANSKEMSLVSTRITREERVSADELYLAGTTLKVYWSLLSKRPDSVGFREIQKELGFSSPSSALYQLDKLVRLGLLEKDAMGDYVVRRIVKVGLLNNFSYVGKHSVPKNAVYGCMTLLINSICVALLVSVRLSPVAYLALLPGVFASVVFFYEASKAWKYKRKVFEAADTESNRRGVRERR